MMVLLFCNYFVSINFYSFVFKFGISSFNAFKYVQKGTGKHTSKKETGESITLTAKVGRRLKRRVLVVIREVEKLGSRWMSREFKVGLSQKALMVSALGENPSSSLLVRQAKSEEAYLIALAPLRHYRVSPPIEIREVAIPSLTKVFCKLGSNIEFDSRRLCPYSEKRH